MMKKSLAELTMNDVLAALPLLVEPNSDRFVYNLEIPEPDGVRIPKDKYWVAIEKGKVEFGEGHSTEPGVTLFQVTNGGLDTLIMFQTVGFKAATVALLMGYVFTDNIKKSEAWFKILKIGEKEFIEALKKNDIEVTDTNLPIYDELGLR